MIDLPPPNYEQTIEAIVQCEIPRANISIAYQDYLQSDEITISDLGALTTEKLRCLKSAAHPFYILTIEDEAQRTAFYRFSERDDRPQRLAEARDWLRTNGMLDRPPSYDPRLGINAFAIALETACGLAPGSALAPHGASALAIRPDFVLSQDFEALTGPLTCLNQMFTASNAAEHEISFVLIGNAALSKSNED